MRTACAVAALLALGCVERLWDVGALEAREARLAAVGVARLGDATPYPLPAGDVLTLFLCRWPDGEAIPVSLPADATPEERRGMQAALRAWEQAGLGVRFAPSADAAGGIAISFIGDVPIGEPTPRSGRTGADCALDADAVDGNAPDRVLPARLGAASVELLRFGRNILGQDVPYDEDELAGAVLHELGHALGFQGHSSRDDTIMSLSVDVARRAGRRILAGGSFRDDTLRALYAVPSGSVVRRLPLPRGTTGDLDRLALLARRRGLAGPFVRVGDRSARIFWRDAAGARYRIAVYGLRDAAVRPAGLALFPLADARRLLAGD